MRTLLLWVVAFAAGFLGWRVATPARASARAPAPSLPPAAPEPPPLQVAEARALRKRLDLLETVPLRELVLYGKEPLADRMRRARGLEESERRQTLRDWAWRAVCDRTKAQEMLALVRQEEDREILSWLAEMIDLACLTKLTLDATFTDDEKRAMFPLALGGEPFERRIAALRVIGGDRSSGLPAEVQALLGDVLRRDPEPAVVAAAAQEIEQRYAPETLPALLDAWRRLPPGDARQQVARSYAKWATWPDLKERFAEARGPEDYDEWARAWAPWLCFFKDGWDKDLAAIYRETAARDVRRDVFFQLANAAPPFLDLMRRVAEIEADPDLRARYAKLLAAPGAKELREMDIYAVLYR